MKAKYDKYWGTIEKINPILFVVVLLDPRFKEAYVAICFETLCGGNLEDAQREGK